MNKYQIANELKEIERTLEMTFEEEVKTVLKDAEEEFYNPYNYMGKKELQIKRLKEFINSYEENRTYLVERAKALQQSLDDMQFYEFLLNEIRSADIRETTQSVVNRQTRENYIMIEKHYVVNDEYSIEDWLADADPENFLGFQ